MNADARQMVIYESAHWIITYPSSISPLHAEGQEATSHVQLMPKEHTSSSLELDEESFRELSSLKKMISRFFHKQVGP